MNSNPSIKELLVRIALQNQIKAFAEVLVEDRDTRRRKRLVRDIEQIKNAIEQADADRNYWKVDELISELLEVQEMLDLM